MNWHIAERKALWICIGALQALNSVDGWPPTPKDWIGVALGALVAWRAFIDRSEVIYYDGEPNKMQEKYDGQIQTGCSGH